MPEEQNFEFDGVIWQRPALYTGKCPTKEATTSGISDMDWPQNQKHKNWHYKNKQREN